MYEGSLLNPTPEDQLPEPFDYIAEAQKARERREAKELAEKTSREEARKKAREEKLAKQIARSASARKDTSSRRQKKNAQVVETTPREQIEKPEVIPTVVPEAKVVEPTPAPKLEMNFTNDSEYTDKDLSNGNEAVFNLNTKVEESKPAVDTADEVLARAEAIKRAREAIHDVESTIEDEVAGVVAPHVRKTEPTIYDLGKDKDELRQRFEESWVTPDQNTQETTVPTEEATLPAPIIPERNPDVVSIEPEEVRVQSYEMPVTVEAHPQGVPSFELPPVPEGGVTETIRPVVNENAAIPGWITTFEQDLRQGRATEIKKWQRDVLRVQHPELLRAYDSLTGNSHETLGEQNYETLQDKPLDSIRPLSDFDADYGSTRQMPSFMNPQAVPQLSYTYQASSGQSDGGAISATNMFAMIIVGGVVFGAILIAVFGF